MLRDLYFYPLAIAVIAGIIFTALSFGAHEGISDDEILSGGFEVSGEALAGLTASPGTNYEFVPALSGTPAYARLWTEIARENAVASAGVFAALNSDYERVFGGRKLRMTITARQSEADSLSEFDMGYFTAGAGDSGWQRRTLTPEWKDYSFTFSPGAPQGEADIDYFGIWPGEAGQSRAMDVRQMRIEVLPQ